MAAHNVNKSLLRRCRPGHVTLRDGRLPPEGYQGVNVYVCVCVLVTEKEYIGLCEYMRGERGRVNKEAQNTLVEHV